MAAVAHALSTYKLQRSYGRVTALEPISLTIPAGQHVVIIGRSGAGKSTLLHLLAGMDRASGGRVEFGGQDFSTASDEQLATIRRLHFGFVFQSGRLVPYLSAEENVGLPIMLAGVKRRRALERAGKLLGDLGIDALAARRPGELSGGEAQRVAIARAVAHEPDVVFADEPTGNLDSESAAAAVDLLMAATQGRTLILVTHDEDLARRFDRCLRLQDGQLVDDSTLRNTEFR